MKLDAGQLNILRLVKKGMAEHGGWAPVSDVIWRRVIPLIPDDLLEKDDGERKVRLTERGTTVLFYS